MACRLPEAPPSAGDRRDLGRAGLPRDVARRARRGRRYRPGVRAALVAVALLGGLRRGGGVLPAHPGRLGAPDGGRAARGPADRPGRGGGRRARRPREPAAPVGARGRARCGDGALRSHRVGDHPAGMVGVAVFYGAYRCVLVVVDARLQERIESRSRATVTSVAGVGTEHRHLRRVRGMGPRRDSAGGGARRADRRRAADAASHAGVVGSGAPVGRHPPWRGRQTAAA